MKKEDKIIIFESKKIRRIWYENDWFYSVVDVVQVLTDSVDARKYWNKLHQRLREEGNEVVTICHQLKLEASDGKSRLTDCANTKGIFRIIQSIPSKKAEPFKMWLAQVGQERIEEIENPELAQERIKMIYEKKGYSKSWIDKRLRSIAVRQDLTDVWNEKGIKDRKAYAILTAEISKATFGMSPSKYKEFKNIAKKSKTNLRDNMTDLELIFTMLGEASTSELEKTKNTSNFNDHKNLAKKGGNIAKNARLELEQETGKKVVSAKNYLDLKEQNSID